jgi:glycosyltransferase involved in cell wall biosynthesis
MGQGSRPRTALLANPGGELYGSDRMALETVSSLLERGWRVVVTLPTSGPLARELVSQGAEVVPRSTVVLRRSYLHGAGPLRLGVRALRDAIPGWRLLRRIRPDVVYVNTITLPLWLVLARLCRTAVVCHVHEAEADLPRTARAALSAPLLLADRVVANSRFTMRVLRESVPRLSTRTVVIHNGVIGPPAPTAPRTDLDGAVRLLYLGRLSERKGVRDAVDAVAELRERGTVAHLRIVGSIFPGYEWFEEELRQRVEDLALADVVTLEDFEPEVWKHLASSDILLVPSRSPESFGNVAVEGVLAARPVVATSSGGLVEAVEGMEASRSVPPGEPDRLAAAVTDLVAHWPDVREMVLADAERAARRFDPAVYRTRIAEEVEAVVRSAGRRRGG